MQDEPVQDARPQRQRNFFADYLLRGLEKRVVHDARGAGGLTRAAGDAEVEVFFERTPGADPSLAERFHEKYPAAG